MEVGWGRKGPGSPQPSPEAATPHPRIPGSPRRRRGCRRAGRRPCSPCRLSRRGGCSPSSSPRPRRAAGRPRPPVAFADMERGQQARHRADQLSGKVRRHLLDHVPARAATCSGRMSARCDAPRCVPITIAPAADRWTTMRLRPSIAPRKTQRPGRQPPTTSRAPPRRRIREQAAFIGLEADAMLAAGDAHDAQRRAPARAAELARRSRSAAVGLMAASAPTMARSAISASSAGAPVKPSDIPRR